jgi:DNA-binding FrmR family transcriptional regulator
VQNLQKGQDIKDNLDKRLKRIEGQVKGVRRMIDEGKTCQDVLTQVAAARSALKMVGNLVLNHHATECLCSNVSAKDKKTKAEELQKLIQTITRFAD